ncbi:MAG TPA: hypothetical protein PKE45_02000, partial [Caldilineaceae bacterium]|nr:hypothetical protein [Caldilineaceae bacterium]
MVSSPSAKIPHHIQPRAGVVVRLLVCLAILIGSGPLPAATVARAQSAPVTGAAADSPSAGMIVQSAAGASALDVSPAAADAIVSDPRNPAWQTRYGSLLGKLSLVPRYATFEAVMAGPDVPVGAWQPHPRQGAAKPTPAIVAAPDGRLFAGVNNTGLRVYAPAANGVYSWSEIKSAANQLASNNVTALAIFRNQLWVGTSDAGISVLDLAANTWTTFNTGNGLP